MQQFAIDMLRHYLEPHRTYHGVRHPLDMLTIFNGRSIYGVPELDLRARCFEPKRVEHMIYVHDAIYDSSRSDNEERSAILYEDYARANFAKDNRLERLIQAVVLGVRLSKGHMIPQSLWHDDPQLANDIAIFLSVDLAQFAADTEKFNQNSADIRLEYSQYSDEEWADGRHQFFLGMVQFRETIFPHRICEEVWGEKARENLQQGLNKVWSSCK